jgi:hypothetical protein
MIACFTLAARQLTGELGHYLLAESAPSMVFIRLCRANVEWTAGGAGNLSQRWTGLSLVGSRSGLKFLLPPCLNWERRLLHFE